MDTSRYDRVDKVPVELIHALPASKVKTITYPGENGYRVTSLRFLPVPETTFVCDSLLAENLNKFIDDAKVRPFSNIHARINYYLRRNSKIGNLEKENGRNKL